MKRKIGMVGFLKMGIGHYIAHLYQQLEKDYDLSVITYTHGAPGDKLIVEDEIIKRNIKNYQQLINPHGFENTHNSTVNFFANLEKNQYDILNLHVSAYTRLTAHIFIPAIEYFKKKGLKVLYTVHDVMPIHEQGKPSLFLQYFYSLADCCIVGNETEKKSLSQTFAYKQPILIATHGVYHLFNSGQVTRKAALTNLKLSDKQKVILFFGILRENKGLADLIKAFNLISTQTEFKELILMIVVSLRSGVDIAPYEQMIAKYGLNNRVKLVINKDSSSVREIEYYFQACDLVVLPYTGVSQSGILNLAFAFNKPSVISNLFAESQMVDQQLGLVCLPNNPQDLADKISQFFSQETILQPKFTKNIIQYGKENGFNQTARIHHQAIKLLLKP